MEPFSQRSWSSPPSWSSPWSQRGFSPWIITMTEITEKESKYYDWRHFLDISRYLSISTLLDFKFFTLIGFIAPKVNLQRNCANCNLAGFLSRVRQCNSSFLILKLSKMFRDPRAVRTRTFSTKATPPKKYFFESNGHKTCVSPTHIKVRVTEILWVLICSPCNVSHSQAQAGVGPPQTLCRSSEEGKLNVNVSL